MGKMFDTFANSKVLKNLDQIKAQGYTAIGGYYFRSSAFKELLTNDYAKKISAAGLYLVSVWENGTPTSRDYFKNFFTTASADATTACAKAISAGQPFDTTIYFAVDYDASTEDLSLISGYFKQIHSLLYPSTNQRYKVGVYGSGLVCRHLKELGLVSHTWLSESRGWAGFEDWKPHADIIQTGTSILLGIDVDTDTTNGNAGGWKCQ